MGLEPVIIMYFALMTSTVPSCFAMLISSLDLKPAIPSTTVIFIFLHQKFYAFTGLIYYFILSFDHGRHINVEST